DRYPSVGTKLPNPGEMAPPDQVCPGYVEPACSQATPQYRSISQSVTEAAKSPASCSKSATAFSRIGLPSQSRSHGLSRRDEERERSSTPMPLGWTPSFAAPMAASETARAVAAS